MNIVNANNKLRRCARELRVVDDTFQHGRGALATAWLALVIPKLHVANIFELLQHAYSACFLLLREACYQHPKVLAVVTNVLCSDLMFRSQYLRCTEAYNCEIVCEGYRSIVE